MPPSWREKRLQTLSSKKSTDMNGQTSEKDLTQSSPKKRGNDMRVIAKFGMMMIASALLTAGPVQAQEMQMPPQEQHHQMNIPVVKPEYPRMGRTQENAKGSLITLEQVQKIAIESNPTLRQAGTETRAAKARKQQAVLYPHPKVAYTGGEVRGGPVGGVE